MSERSHWAAFASLLLATLMGLTLWLHTDYARGDLRVTPAWYDENAVGTAPDWHYRVPVSVPAGLVANQTMRMDVDFAPLLTQMGVSGTIDANSIRITQSNGTTVVSGDYNDARYAGGNDAANNNRGEVRFILATSGAATYYLYFDLTANGAKPVAANAINSGFESGGTGAVTPSGWAVTRSNAAFDAQIRPAENPSITGNGGTPSPQVVDGSPFSGAFSYMMGARTNNEPANGSVVLTKTFTKPSSCPGGFSMQYRVQGWDASWGGATQWDYFSIVLSGTLTTTLMGPSAPGANGNYANFPYSPNFGSGGSNAVSNTQSGYGPYNGFDTNNSGGHTLGMTLNRGDEPWFTLTNNLAAYATGSTVTITISANLATQYKSWLHLDDVEWCLVTGATLGTPEAFGVDITAPTAATQVAQGGTLPITVNVNADPNTMSAQIINPSGTVMATVALTDIGGGVWQNASAYTFTGTDPTGTWTVKVLGFDGSTSTIGATNGLIRIVGQPNSPFTQANFYNIDEQTFEVTAPLGRYNAWDLPLPGGGIFTPVTGKITTKVAGVAFRVGIVRLNAARTAIENTNEANVQVALLDTSDNSGALNTTTGCRASWTVIAPPAIPNVNLANGKLSTVDINVPQAYKDVRVRVIGSQGTACSQDNFAIRPQSFTVAVTDTNWTTAGTARTLNATAFNGAPTHKAGRPFTVTVSAVTPAGATNYLATGNHTGMPTLLNSNCTNPTGGTPACSACSNGTLTPGTFASVAGPVLRSTTASYSEAGTLSLQLHDVDFAAVDSADGTPDTYSNTSATNYNLFGRRVPQIAALAVGRFVPDHFVVAPGNTPQFQTFGTAEGTCNTAVTSPRRSFTYIGQAFGYVTPPTAGIEARNAAGVITANYRQCLWQIGTGQVAQVYANAPVRTLDTAGILTPTVTPGSGTGTVAANVNDRLAYTRDNSATGAAAPFNANLSLTVSVSDASQADGTITTLTATPFNGGGTGIAFDSGAAFRYGVLRLGSVSGSPLQPLKVPVETQYWSGTFFISNAGDHCTTLAPANIGLGNYLSNITAGETTVSAVASPLNAGRGTITLSAPGAGTPADRNSGSVDVAVHLGTGANADACPAFTPAATAGNKPYLRGKWCGTTYTKDPVARARFGIRSGSDEQIYNREITN